MHCPYFEQHICRSCQLLEQPYEATLQHKQEQLRLLFPDVPVSDIVPTRQIPGCRIRARMAVFGTWDNPQFGFLDDQQRIVAVDQCPLHHPQINDCVSRLPAVIRQCRLVPWLLADDRGELKYVILTYSPTHHQLMLQLVLRSREAIDRVRSAWRQARDTLFPDVSVLSINIQPVRSSALNGVAEIGISDNQRFPLRYGQTTVLYGPQSFVQTNYEIAEQLYLRAASRLREIHPASLLDLYCGTGAFSLCAGDLNTRILGLDVAADSIACANDAAAAAGLHLARYACSGNHLPEIPSTDGMPVVGTPADRIPVCDAVVCNPPRRGLDEAARQLLLTTKPRRLMYSSCNPVTLQRDAELLSSQFRLEHIEPFDMFPFTRHLEVLATLSSLSTE